MSNNDAVFNKEVELLQKAFPGGHLIKLQEAADYCGCDMRTLEARRDFPLIRLGNKGVVSLTNLAMWLTVTRGKA